MRSCCSKIYSICRGPEGSITQGRTNRRVWYDGFTRSSPAAAVAWRNLRIWQRCSSLSPRARGPPTDRKRRLPRISHCDCRHTARASRSRLPRSAELQLDYTKTEVSCTNILAHAQQPQRQEQNLSCSDREFIACATAANGVVPQVHGRRSRLPFEVRTTTRYRNVPTSRSLAGFFPRNQSGMRPSPPHHLPSCEVGWAGGL